ncbi:MAG: hypothetical protein L6Q78_15945 [Bacteroidia bacterium]|nr:hypothetical protein [Bacteroidia bacterium]
MEIRDLSNDELDEYIETYQDRIETMSEYISDTEDYATRSAMNDELIKYRMTLRALLQEREIRSKSVKSNSLIDLDNFIFESSDHLRYENKIHVSGPHGGAKRIIKVEKNISGLSGYTVTLFNGDGDHPIWQNNVQMAPKAMKIIEANNEKIVLRGFGHDIMGSSFSDYGMTIILSNNIVEKCFLHMHDRNVDIEYLK